jgi:hypothetical protein
MGRIVIRSQKKQGLILPVLSIDGQDVPNCNISFRPTEVFIGDYESAELLTQHFFSEISYTIPKIGFIYKPSWTQLIKSIDLVRGDKNNLEIVFNYGFNHAGWKGLFSYGEFMQAFELILKEGKYINMHFKEGDGEKVGFAVHFEVTNYDEPIYVSIDECDAVLAGLDYQVYRSLTEGAYKNSVVLHLNLPEEVRISCEQYLLYFVEFLSDLGVEATAELQHKVGEVLFSVTPTNTEDALEKIKTALEIYLHLPSSIIVGSSSSENEIAILKLEANINHLKGQLRLEQATLQAKDATIQAQQFLIRQQELILSGEILIESIKPPSTQGAEDKIDLFGGKFSITKLKKEGFEVDLPKIFKSLKDLFQKKK